MYDEKLGVWHFWGSMIFFNVAFFPMHFSGLAGMRQVRLAEGKESERIERVWLITGNDAPAPELLAEHPRLHVVHAEPGLIGKILPAQTSPADHIYVVDPLGNLMMRFPRDPDPRRILRDMSRLLRHSKWK